MLVDHFYDRDHAADARLRSAPSRRRRRSTRDLMREFWLGSTEGGGAKLNELITQPALNIRGMASSRIGNQASNVIPSTATATIDIRLVQGMDREDYRARGGAHSQAGILRGGSRSPTRRCAGRMRRSRMVIVRGRR